MSQWSKRYDRCVGCGTTEVRHKGHGMCRRCHCSWRYRNDRELAERMKRRAKAHYLANADAAIERARTWKRQNPARAREHKKGHDDRYRAKFGAGRNAKYVVGAVVEFGGYRYALQGRPFWREGARFVIAACVLTGIVTELPVQGLRVVEFDRHAYGDRRVS